MGLTSRGIIRGFRGSWSSGLGILFVDTKRGLESIPCDNGATVRALAAAFGDEVIGEGHTVNNEALAGREIYYDVAPSGVFEAFTPVEMWTGPEIDDEQESLEKWL